MLAECFNAIGNRPNLFQHSDPLPTLTVESIELIVQQLKRGKACGPDDRSAGHL